MLRFHPPLALRTSAIGLARPSSVTSPRILIIEDELLIALMIEEICRGAGYQVSGVAYTAVMARDKVANKNFDAVLLDVSVGGIPKLVDGLVAKHIPCAFVTGYDYLVEPRHETIPVLQKPFTPSDLRKLLATLVA